MDVFMRGKEKVVGYINFGIHRLDTYSERMETFAIDLGEYEGRKCCALGGIY